MSPQVAADFFGILLLGGLVGLVAAIVPVVPVELRGNALPLAAAVAVGATGGSLYFSEIAGFLPCELCWFQRVFMYPLAIVIGLAAARSDNTVRRHALPVAGLGLLVAGYHVQLQAFPDQGSFCELTNPCTASPIKALGWMTIPHMSAAAFVCVIGLLWLIPTDPTKESDPCAQP